MDLNEWIENHSIAKDIKKLPNRSIQSNGKKSSTNLDTQKAAKQQRVAQNDRLNEDKVTLS